MGYVHSYACLVQIDKTEILAYWNYSERVEFIYRLYSTWFKLYKREIQTYLDSALNPIFSFKSLGI